MTLSKSSAPSWFEKALRSLGKGLTGAALLAGSAALTAGCLDRPVTPAKPTTNNVFIGQIRQTGVDKIDLLFMIDNSISMADKQEILALAVPVLVNRLIAPICIDRDGNPTGNTSPNCGPNASAEFKAIEDIHIGIVTSSIGDHGSNDFCSAITATPENTYDDLAQLVPTVRPGAMVPSWNDSGFLVWDPRRAEGGIMPHSPPGYGAQGGPGGADQMVADFALQLAAAGEHGCGYEAQLESWYRFLVDPAPVMGMTNQAGFSVRGALNTTLLAQRAQFLRPDSLLAIIMLTDENDCSILDEEGTQGWLVPYKGGALVNNWRMPRGRAICMTNPNDPSCGLCTEGDADPTCANLYLTGEEDAMNLRCFKQRQRFGVDLLYPTWRYVEGLTSPTINPRLNGVMEPNPIFVGKPGEPPRDAGLVFLAGIVGVPWQDIATDGSIPGQPNSLDPNTRALQYMTATELRDADRWKVILGEPYNAVDPTDPFMIESIDPRTPGLPHPIMQGVSISAPDAPQLNRINGHEQAVPPMGRSDLQFACIFDLDVDVPCDMMNSAGCDCNADERAKNSPLCEYTNPDPATHGTQVRAKAYPGLRELQVLKDMGSNAIVASICPKNVTAEGMATADANFGYNPAVSAIVSRLKEALTAKCLPRALVPEDNPASPDVGKVPCAVVEVRPKPMGAECPPCDNNVGRFELVGEEAKVISSVKENMSNLSQCGPPPIPTSCDDFCMCKLQQFTGNDLVQCVETQLGADPGGLYGYCYVDPTVNVDNDPEPDAHPSLLESCDPTQKRILRFMGANVPAKDGLAFIACIGEAARATPVQ